MSSPSITSSGTPAFNGSTRESTGSASKGNGGSNRSDSSGNDSNSGRQISLKTLVQRDKQQELQQQGQKLINLKMISDDLSVKDQLPGPPSGGEGMKAVMVSQDENNPTDFQVEILRVRPDGSTTTLFQSDTPSLPGNSSSAQDLNLRGSVMDTLR